MKVIHLLLVAVVTCTFFLTNLTATSFAASDKSMATTKVTSAKSSKTKKEIPHDVNINSADKKLLTQLPGIGPVTAGAILKYRKDKGKFKSVDELTQVKGIGNKTLAKLKPYLLKL